MNSVQEAGQVQPIKQTLRANPELLYNHNSSERSVPYYLGYIIKSKAARKLPNTSLQADFRPMNIVQEVIQQITLPTGAKKEASLQHKITILRSCHTAF